MTIAMKIGKKLPMCIKGRLSQIYLKRYVNKLKAQDKRYVRTKIDGIRYDLDLWTYVGCTFFNLKTYEPRTVKIMKDIIKSGMVAIDVGASFGILSFTMAQLVGEDGKVYCFEPSFYMFKKLERGIKLNGFINITPEKLALSDSNRTETLITKKFGVIGSNEKNEETEEVNFITLDSYVKEKNIEDINFIKIDTDGHEVEVIKGAEKCIRDNHPMMIVEFRKETVKELMDLLSDLGYNFFDEGMMLYTKEKLIKKVEKEVINVVVK